MQSVTESSSAFTNLSSMATGDILRAINGEDMKVAAAVSLAIPAIERLVEQASLRMRQGGRVFYIGAGTSGRLGVLDASEILPTYGLADLFIGLMAGGDSALRNPAEDAEDNREQAWQVMQSMNAKPCDTLIGLAASGTTPFVIGGIEKARTAGLLTGCITCNRASPLAQAAEYPIEVVVGPEIVTGSTRMKAGTAEKMVLNMISTTLMIRMGRVEGNRMVNMRPTNHKLRERGAAMLAEALGVDMDRARALLLQYGSVKAAVDAQKIVETTMQKVSTADNVVQKKSF